MSPIPQTHKIRLKPILDLGRVIEADTSAYAYPVQ